MNYQRVFWNTFTMEIAVAAAVFGLVLLIVLGAVIFRRRGAKRKFLANHNRKLEIGYVVLLAGVAAYLVSWSISANRTVRAAPPADSPRGARRPNSCRSRCPRARPRAPG
jgi:heme/copper-type cytochrome/quinol oxidase subunit 2